MKREEKYKNTDVFTFYNANPKGKYTSDCVIRAICTIMGISWEDTLIRMTELGIKYGYSYDDPKLIAKYLQLNGFVKHKQPRKIDNTKYTGEEFCRKFRPTCVTNIGGHHMVAIVDGKILDTWDSSYGCIGNY